MKTTLHLFAVWIITLCSIIFPQSNEHVDAAPHVVSASRPMQQVTHAPPQTRDDCGFFPETPIDGGSGTVRGVIRDVTTQQPLSGVAVYVCGYGQGNVRQYSYEVYSQARTETDATGAFSISNLPTATNQGPLTYAVVVSPTVATGSTHEVLPLRNVVITETTRLDVLLRPGASIGGAITDEHTGEPLAGVRVFSRFEAEPITLQSRLLWSETVSDADGRYMLRNLSSADYALFYEPPDPAYVWEEYPGVPHYLSDFTQSFTPQRIPVVAGRTIRGIDASLRRYATLEGRVIAAVNGEPIPNAEVSFGVDDPGLFYPFGERRYYTDAEGRFRALLPSGGYRVLVKPPAASGYPPQYYFDVARPDIYPLSIPVQQPETVEITIGLRQPGRITGRVRYRSGRGIPSATVSERYLGQEYAVHEDGSFELPFLVPRTYRLYATFNNPQSFNSHSRSVKVYVGEGETVPGVEIIFPDPVYVPQLHVP
jgi:hypothetical protein